jgi:predicted ATPase
VAIAVGEAELADRSEGVWFADLAAVTITNGGEVPAAIAKAVGLSLREGDPTEQVVDHLADKSALVILDNCEHVIDACAEFAEALLLRRGECVFLTTSREALGVDGEVTMRLGPLPADDENAPAVLLFTERARSADSQFVADEKSAP